MMNTATAHRTPAPHRPPLDAVGAAPRRWPPGFTVAAGAFYTCMAGVHIGIVSAGPQTYADFADQSQTDLVRTLWADVFMANPQAWGLFAAALEITLGVVLLLGGRAAKLGWGGVIAFQVALVAFGWAFLLWSVPAGAVALLAARHDWPSLERLDRPERPVGTL